MGLSFSRRDGIVVIVSTGDFSVGDARGIFAEIAAAAPAGEPLRILIDDDGTDFNPDSEDVRRMVADWARNLGDFHVRVALLVKRDLHYGIGRMAVTFAEDIGFPLAVFRNRTEALAWLDSDLSA